MDKKEARKLYTTRKALHEEGACSHYYNRLMKVAKYPAPKEHIPIMLVYKICGPWATGWLFSHSGRIFPWKIASQVRQYMQSDKALDSDGDPYVEYSKSQAAKRQIEIFKELFGEE